MQHEHYPHDALGNIGNRVSKGGYSVVLRRHLVLKPSDFCLRVVELVFERVHCLFMLYRPGSSMVG